MIGGFIGKSRANERFARDMYATIVARARQPTLYGRFGVPDTIDGRFEMVVLHTVLLFQRLRREGKEGQDLAQRVFNLFVTDMDMSLRELGVGDLGVPKRMKDVGRSFYGRIDAYGEPLADLDQVQLCEALHRNLFPGEPETPALTTELAKYAIEASLVLNDVPVTDLKAGNIGFPEVARATLIG